MKPEDKIQAVGLHQKTDEQGKKLGITSVEAAALYMSDGATADPEKAEILASGDAIDFDERIRSRLSKAMGFDFELRYRPRKIHVHSKSGPKVSTHAKIQPGEVDKYGNIVSEELIGRLVQACMKLKDKWDDANAN